MVALSSSNVDAARVPASVMVAAGSTSTLFTINASTVTMAAATTITASYGGVTRSASLSVLPPALTAIFSVTSPQKGTDACVLGPELDQTDCLLDARSSTGFIDRFTWRYWTVEGAAIGHTATDPQSRQSIGNRCAFFNDARGGDDAQGNKYIHMTIEVVALDRQGARSAPVQRAIRLYPNRLCGFSY